MYEVDIDYESSFRYKINSLNYEIKVDFPKPDKAMEGITPPALLLASLGSCLAVYTEKYLTEAKIKFDKFFIKVKSDICRESPRYLKSIDVMITLKGARLDARRKDALMVFLRNCPVHNTLKHNPVVDIIVEEK